MNWDHLDTWWAASISLNAIWFIYAMIQSRHTRKEIAFIKSTLFEAAPHLHAQQLLKHFKKQKLEEGTLLMTSCLALLPQEKKKVQRKEKA